jgi:hypothetical protein
VDFPIIPINQIATIEGNAGKPIYQMSKWWARRHSSVFRSMLLAGAMKAPEDESRAAKAVWDAYYANHQKRGSLRHIKVADPFMGGGTTIVEGSRLGMQMFGCDLNPVAWFVAKNEMEQVDIAELKRLLANIEAEVKPQIMAKRENGSGARAPRNSARLLCNPIFSIRINQVIQRLRTTGKNFRLSSTFSPCHGKSGISTVTKDRKSSTPSGQSTGLANAKDAGIARPSCLRRSWPSKRLP